MSVPEQYLNVYKPRPGVDEDYARQAQADAERRLFQNPTLNPTPEAPEAPADGGPPEVPGRKAPDASVFDQPSVAGAGLQTMVDQLRQGVVAIVNGLMRIPQGEPGKGAHQVVMEGLMPMLASPITGLFAAGGQTLEKLAPETANAVFLEGPGAESFMRMASLKFNEPLTPEESAAFKQPITVRQALEVLGPFALPAVPKAVKGAKTAGKIVAQEFKAAPERGSLGVPPRESAVPAVEGVPKPAEGATARVNLGRIEGSEQLKATIEDLNKFAAERLEQHRARKGHDTQLAEAAKLRWSVEQMLSHEPETILVDEPHAFRLRETARAAAERYDTLGRLALDGDPAALAKLQDLYPIAVKLSALDEAQGRNLARGLEMRKEMATGTLAAKTGTEALLELSRKMGEGEPDPLLAYRRYQMLRPDQRRGFFVNLYNGLRFGRDAMHAVWIQSLLSNPKTHFANMGATSFVIAGDIPETMVAGWVNQAFFRNPEGVQLSEAAIKLTSLVEAQADGFRMMAKAWQTGEDPFQQPTPMTEHPRIAAERYGFSPDTQFGRFIDVTGAALRSKAMPTRALVAEDAYMKGVAWRLEINALAKREALAEGKEGRALMRRVKELEERPTLDMIEQAKDQATLLTLNRELGPAGRAFMTAMNALPFGRVIFPFLRTPINSAKYIGQRFPVLAQLSVQNWSDMLAGGALRDKAIARQVVGAGASMVIAYEVSAGRITGAGPVNKQLAALQRDPNTSTKPPNSICPDWTDECYGINRLDPVLGGFVLGVANYVELASQIPDQDAYDEWAAYGETFVTAGGQLFVNKANLQGLANLLESLRRDEGSLRGKLVQSYARTVVPAGLRELTRTLDDNLAREVKSLPDAIKSGLPWAVGDVPVHRNHITGEFVNTPPGWGGSVLGAVIPVTVTKKNTHPVFMEIQENRIVLPPFPDYIGRKPDDGPQTAPERPGAGVKLTREEKQRGIDFQTQDHLNGRTLFEALTHLVQSDRYQKGSKYPGGTRDLLFRATYSAYRERAIEKLTDPKRGSPNLGRDIRQKQEQAINQTRRVTDPKSPQYQGGGGGLLDSLRR